MPGIRAARAAVRTQAVELDPVRVEDEAGPRQDVARDRVEAQVTHLGGSPAARAHDVVMVAGLADHIGMGAIGQIDALDETEFLEQLERPEHRRAAYGESPSLGLANQVPGGKEFVTIGEELGDRPAGRGHEVAGTIECVSPGLRVCHG
jgi:hypothetical protein